ncbi:vacuolar protein sorting-associated protein 54-like [Argiope bruennichi]|uniref:vacuolar protein sorting-associated protein 54-like n=1 Tax=Argiope bruennichi TaxID=94029 RepID=UPI002494611A|nr:vacuolar protein sorting-associated protein 54-like [Argiope bruennichi]
MTSESRSSVAAWKRCNLCAETTFKTAQEFRLHLRQNHCKKEGGSYVCCYGKNNICGSLPLEGVNDQDYEFHVVKHHVLTFTVDDDNSQEEKFVENLRQKYAHIFTAAENNTQPNVVEDKYQWTIYNSSQNLPAVLNDPRKTKREYDLFTKSWGDSFVESASLPPTYLPDINYKHFEIYLKHIRKGIRRNAKKKDQQDKKQHASLCAEKSMSKFADIEEIPKIFLQSDFNLENPSTFNAVLPWSQLYGQGSAENSNQKNSIKLLQEKMSHYLDIAEVHIAKQISMRSEAFFHAMTSHDALMDQLTDVIKCVCDLRERIHVIEEVLVTGPMKILRLKRRQKNLNDIYKKLNLISTVHQTQPTIQKLLNTSDFVGALDMIYTTQDVLAQELSGIHSFRHLGSQLAEMEKVIGKMMVNDFVRYITADLNRPHTELLVMEEEKLIAIVFGMLRQNHFRFVQTFKEECFTTIEATVKQTVIEVVSQSDDFDLESNTGNLAEQLRSLSFHKWMEMFQLIMKNLHFLLQRIQALYQVMDDTLEVAAGYIANINTDENFHRCHTLHLMETEVMISEQDYLKIKPNLKDVLCSVCDHAHDCCAKILSAKAKDGSLDKLIMPEFLSLAKSIEEFQQKSEEISGKQSTALRLALQSQVSRFVMRFHEERKVKLNLILENEQWKQADVPMEFQELVNDIVSSGCITSIKKNTNENRREPQPYLIVNGENFAVCGTALMLFKMIIEYCQCAEELPMLAPDLANRLVELLKAFNSRTCQLVLGAGALQLVGLKTITTKHLALTSRCLHLIVYFIPYVKNHFQSKIPVKQQKLDKQFEQVSKIYMEHIREISHKLESIISDMFETQLRKWEVKAPVPSPSFNAISKQLTKVHEFVHNVLSPEELNNIFLRVNNNFKNKLRDHLARLQVNNDGGPQHGLVTQELTFYIQNLKKLQVPCDFNMNDLWQSR